MVKIAIAGGAGKIIDVLLATGKHEILILSRKVDYQSQTQLRHALSGVHTLLSFISEQDDPASPLQKNIIRAAVDAGVKRFAPSEWASWYSYKGEIRRYLEEEVNKDEQILEYTLFQPGYFLNYLTSPYKSSNYLQQMQTPFDFDEGRFIMIDGSDNDRITLTTVQDLAQVVARAVEYEGKWPVVGGISGVELSMKQIIELGESIRGKTFKVEKIPIVELRDGSWKSSWSPKIDHPSIPPQKDDRLSRIMVSGILQAISAGDLVSSNEWNRLLPDLEFAQSEKFLANVWDGKP
ncbi:unnamed protein product [Aureobasidium uvarum]|uniref:NmrA-like domain-containing protein n=1 Tax=Aureobasidium uvarum TaxID=2773716 RepID=A0A9N8PP38_9PEZI|nr:unnamed protein product [Aureobasidium uvarum]